LVAGFCKFSEIINNYADIIPSSSSIVVAENKILSIRDTQVILDRDLAELYGVETRVLNQAVSRNIERFPLEFRFQLTADEFDNLKSHFVISSWGGVRKLPFAFTEQGVAMLSALLRSPQAITTSVAIMKAFVAMRRYLTANAQILHRLDRLDRKQLENEQNFEKIFAKFEENEPVRQGVFFDGQTYDAYAFVSDRIREAKSRIVLIDNYVDDTVLTILDKRSAGVSAIIYTMRINKTLQLDIDKHNVQYPKIDVKIFTNSHDRFLIIDDHIYHFGASIKDLGKKWFAVTLMTEYTADELLSHM
jgi:hypothetical protein